MEKWEHGTLIATQLRGGGGNIEFLTERDTETVNPESANLCRQMSALDVLSGDGWDVVAANVVVTDTGAQVATYLVRRPKE